MKRLVAIIVFGSILSFGYPHRIQLNLNVANMYYSLGDPFAVSVLGTKNVNIQIYDGNSKQPIWQINKDMVVDNGSVSLSIQDNALDWVKYLRTSDLFFRVTIDNNYQDFPFDFLPYSLLSDTSNRARFFDQDNVFFIDYPGQRLLVNESNTDHKLSINGRVSANYLVGNGRQLSNITGPGFNDGYSLNSANGVHKDVLFINEIGNVGINTTTPTTRLHIKGNTVFRGVMDQTDVSSYLVPSGPLMLWDPFKSVFRSGNSSIPIPSSFLGKYSVGFGENVVVKSMYSSVLGGQSHLIDSNSISSVILGGQNHSILDNYSVIAGGYGSLVSGEWSVVFGGREHSIYGDYNVVLGGKSNEIRGMSNMVLGQTNRVRADHTIVLGQHHQVSSNRGVAMGQSVAIRLNSDRSIGYADTPLIITRPGQVVIHSKEGVGINTAPESPHQLTVDGNIKAGRFIGDGRYLTNVVLGQDFWRQKKNDDGQIQGMHYMNGPVSVGLIDTHAMLSVNGGIQLQTAEQASNGTLSYSAQNGLQFYNNGWVSVDQIDTDTLLAPGVSLQLNNNREFSIHPLDASRWDVLYFNGATWAPQKVRIWNPGINGIDLPKNLALTQMAGPTVKGTLVVQEPDGGTDTSYPLVVGQTDAIRFNPTKNAVLFNLDTTDNGYRMVDSLLSETKKKGYGGAIDVKDGELNFRQTVTPYYRGEVAEIRELLNLSPTSMYVNTNAPAATFDSLGNISFMNTVVDANGVGVGFRQHMANQFPNALALDNISNLNFYAGVIDQGVRMPQPIYFKTGGQNRVTVTDASEWVVGDGLARAKLSVFGGGVALNVNNTLVKTTLYYDQFTQLHSVSADDSSIRFNVKLKSLPDVITMADFGHLNTAFGTTNTELISLLAYSEHDPRVALQSNRQSVVLLENDIATFSIQNNQGLFSVTRHDPSGDVPLLYLDNANHLSLRTATLSQRDSTEVVLNGDIELSNTDEIQFFSRSHEPIAAIKKSLNQLIFQHNNMQPIRFQSKDDAALLLVSGNRKVAIFSDTVTENASLYVVNDVIFKSPIYYTHGGQDQLVQSFVVDTLSVSQPNQTKSIRSVKTLQVDEEAGLGLDVLDGDTIQIKSPGMYVKMFETPLWDGEDLDPTQSPDFIEASGKDILELRETYPNGGVSINLFDMSGDGVMDSIRLYNPLIDGGLIEGDLNVYGNLTLQAVNADGREVTGIPYQWTKDAKDNLYYTKGFVGIQTATPSAWLDVDDVMKTHTLRVSDTLYMHQLDFEKTTATTTNQHILFSVDYNNDDPVDRMMIQSPRQPLLSVVATNETRHVGLFDDTPSADLHIRQSELNSVLFQSKASGVTSLEFNQSATNQGAVIQVTNLKESQLLASRNIYLTANGTDVVFIKPHYVAVGSDPGNDFKNQLFVDFTATVGEGFAGRVIGPERGGLTVEGTMSVGQLTSGSTGATFYSKDSLRVGDIPMPSGFKGVMVKHRVGVGIPAPTEGLSVKGGVKIKDLFTLVDFAGGDLFELTPSTFNLLVDNRPIDFMLSKAMSFDTNTDQRAVSIFHNSVNIGPDPEQDTSANVLINDDSDPSNATLTLEDTVGLPALNFSVDDGAHTAAMGMVPNGDSVAIAINANGTSLSSPDIIIQSERVGFGKSPSSDIRSDGTQDTYAADVNGRVKSQHLYKKGNRMYPVPHGAIVMWSGDYADIPEGWVLCDGRTVDTPQGPKTVPDLKDKFIKGVTMANNTAQDMGESGGSNTGEIAGGEHTHEGGGPHTHGVSEHTNSGLHKHGIVSISGKTVAASEPATSTFPTQTITWMNNTVDTLAVTGTGCHHVLKEPDTCANDYENPFPFIRSRGLVDGFSFKVNASHSHGEPDTHVHTSNYGVENSTGGGHVLSDSGAGPHNHSGGSHTHTWNNEPEYYIFAFIIKVADTE
jgi:hypothetical protein